MYTTEEKIAIIEQSNSFLDLNKDILPKAHKEDYYFVSYSHKDYKQVMKDILLLEDSGINIWYDSDMHIGENWEEIAESYISKYQCKGIIFYLSKNSILSAACNKEVEYVLENNKQFFSINIPLEGEEYAQSGLSMLLNLKKQGHAVSEKLIDNFEKAFSDKLLYLSYTDSLQRKKEQIEKLKGEDLFVFSYDYNTSTSNSSSKLDICRDNSHVRVNFKTNYQINDKESTNFGELLPLETIEKCVFANSFKLAEVVLPPTINKIESNAFINCYKLKNINLQGDYLQRIGDFAFANCESLNIDYIDCNFIYQHAFSQCYSLKDLRLTSVELGSFTFFKCVNLSKIAFDNEPIKFGSHLFYKCKNLKEITIKKGAPNVIENKKSTLVIENGCFDDCTSLKELTFKGKVDLTGAHSLFSGCSSLERVNFELSNFKNIPSGMFMLCNSLTKVSGLEKVKKVGHNAFLDCDSLLNINLDAVTEIEEKAFGGAGLEEAILPNVKKIEDRAFVEMPNLKKIIIGDKLQSLGTFALGSLENLEELEIHSESFEFDYDCVTGVYPEVLTLANLDFLDFALQDMGSRLKTVYVKEGLINEDNIDDFYHLTEQVQSDKAGFDKFIIDNSNPYKKYVGKRIILTLLDGERIFVDCEDVGFDEQKEEYYIVAGRIYYQSEIEDITVPYFL